MIYFIYIFLIVGLYLIVVGTIGAEIDRRLSARLPEATETKVKKEKVRLFFKPVFLAGKFVVIKLRLDEPMRRNIAAAHLNLLPEEFLTIKFIFMIFFYVVATFFIFKKPDLLKGGIALALGYLLPDIWLKRRLTTRKRAIARILPETVDLIGLCIEAGLDFTMAVKWIVEKTQTNPFIEELAFVWEEIKWGKPRSQALKDMSKRLSIPEVSSFVQAIIQAERMGTPVAEAFGIISEDTRARRFQKGERFALTAPIKILFPLLFCILPVIGIIIMGPVFLQFMGSKGVLTEAFK